MKNKKYENYFKTHYKYKLSEADVLNYEKWFYSQWKLITSKIELKKTDKILEIGSGLGGVFNFIKKYGIQEYVGIEMDEEVTEFANTYFKVKHFKNISFEEYSPKKTFDYIFAFEVLEHLDAPDKAIDKIYKSLNNKGIFVGSSPYPYLKNVLADKTHKYVLHPQSWKNMFIEAGFKSVETIPMSFLPSMWRISKNLNVRMPFYIPFPYMISTTLIVAYK